MMMIDKKLQIFQMAAELSNFTEAATALNMTQPNVTRQISLLESELGAKLFERDGRRVKLTPAGETLRRECTLLFADVEQLAQRVHYAARGIRHYRIGATMTAGGYLLPPLLAGYMRLHPQNHLGLHIANTGVIAERLKTHKLDLALVEGPFDRNCFFSTPWGEDEMVAAAAPGTFHGAPPSLAQWINEGKQLILRENGSGTRYHFDRYRQEHHLPIPDSRNIMEVNSFDAIKLLVRNGCGITLISRLAIADELAAGTLEALPFAEGKLRRSLTFIYTANENLKFIEAFIAFCRHPENG